jgi:hypothetical protein
LAQSADPQTVNVITWTNPDATQSALREQIASFVSATGLPFCPTPPCQDQQVIDYVTQWSQGGNMVPLGEADVAVTYDRQLRDLRLVRPDLDLVPKLNVQSWSHGFATQLGQPDLIRFQNTFLRLRFLDGPTDDIHARYFAAALPEGLRFR